MARDRLAETRGLTVDQKGYYLDLLLYTHISSRRGYLIQDSGKAFSHDQLAGMAVVGSAENSSRLMQGLIDAGLIRLSNEGIPYVPWMVEQERKRQEGKKNGKLGGNPLILGRGLTPILTPLVNPGHNPPLNPIPENENEDPGGRGEGGQGEEDREGLRRALIDVFCLFPVTQEELETLTWCVEVLAAKGAKATEVLARRDRWLKSWKGIRCTHVGLVRHWDKFPPPPSDPKETPKPPPLPPEEDDIVFKTAAEQRAWTRNFFASTLGGQR